MTTPDELVERVARALVSPEADPSDWRFWTDEARAAIAVALEEAAKVCHENAKAQAEERDRYSPETVDWQAFNYGCHIAGANARAIRKLIQKEET